MHSIAIFGGTFDPVHEGHLRTSALIQKTFGFDNYIFLPCNVPVIKAPPIASNQQRIEMLQLALQTYPEFKIDLREINRKSPSYMVDTLNSFRMEDKTTAITLILGFDAFMSLPHWHEWKKIIKLANLLVINRPLFSESPWLDHGDSEKCQRNLGLIQKLLTRHRSDNFSDLLHKPSGVIYLFDAGYYDISSTAIRNMLAAISGSSEKASSLPLQDNLLPKPVLEYIKQEKLYQ